jgi:hypothetical protein
MNVLLSISMVNFMIPYFQKISQQRLLQKYQMFTLPNPSHPRPRSAKRDGQGRGLIINPLPLWERARVRGKIDFCKSLNSYSISHPRGLAGSLKFPCSCNRYKCSCKVRRTLKYQPPYYFCHFLGSAGSAKRYLLCHFQPFFFCCAS